MHVYDLFIPMRRPRRWGILPLLLLLAIPRVDAQLHAAFSASPPNGCSPLLVQFTDQSQGNPVSWRWELGNGNRSSIANPAATYFTPGAYTVTLVVTDAAGNVDSVTKTQYINVYPAPVAAFGARDTTGCLPLATAFTDSSTVAQGSIVQWKWDFGDGITASTENPQHTYTASGRFNVTLQVTSNYGCAATTTKVNYIDVPAPVQAAFGAGATASCKPPDTVVFANTSSGPGPLSYAWSFGDGLASSDASPTHIYSQPGLYTVSLTATSPMGCINTLTRTAYISVGQNVATFTTSAPTACTKSPVVFQNTTGLHADSVLWRFGDGQVSRLAGPGHTYGQPGTYSVTLVVYAGACTDSTTRPLVVGVVPNGAFTADKTNGCNTPFPVQFNTDSSGILSYAWDFGDGQTSTVQNPAHTYTHRGIYTVRLILTGAGGCADTVVKPNYITIASPTITLTGVPASGCLPFTLSPGAQVSTSDPVTGYLWTFGDGVTSALQTPSHTYTAQGTYAISLTITTASGCTATVTDSPAVQVGTKPAAAFVATPTNSCVGTSIQFTDQTPNPVDQWRWYFYGSQTVGSTSRNPLYAYGDTGTYTVMLVAGNNGCLDTAIRPLYIHIAPPVARFSAPIDCSQRMTRVFTDQSEAATSWTWNFGDGSTSNNQNPTHTYASPGTYAVTLQVTNGTCTETSRAQVKIIMADPSFQASVAASCKGAPVRFTCAALDTTTVKQIVWTFGDGTTQTTGTVRSVSHVYPRPGSYTVSVKVTDLNGCDTSYTAPLPLPVNGPTAAFTPSPTAVCAGSPVTFNDQSVTDGIHPILSHIWSFGDGVVDSTLTIPYQHIYGSGGSMPAVLTIRDASGCADSTRQNVLVSKPQAGFSVSDTVICVNKTLYFDNQSTGGVSPITYTWYFGDGIAASATNPGFAPSHVYTRPGLDTVTLSIKDALGCTDSLVRPDYIDVQIPKAAFTLPQHVSSCPPLEAQFTNQSAYYSVVHWDFGDGNTSTDVNPVHFYSYPGTYIITLIVTGVSGCTDQATDTVIVHGPTGTFTYSPATGCDSLVTHFSVASDSSVNYVWDYGDGETLSGPQNSTTHTYPDTGTYIPRIILINIDHCQVPVTGQNPIHVYRAYAGLGLSGSSGCGSASVQLRDSSTSNDAVGGWFWDFGDGVTSGLQNPSHTYTQPGNYTLTHAVVTLNGCTDTIRWRDTIHVFQPPAIQLPPDTSACVPITLSFSASVLVGDSLRWYWNLGNGQKATTPVPPPGAYTQAGVYNVTAQVVDAHGCTDSAAEVVTIHPLPATSGGGNYILCQGTPITLQGSGADRYVWSPAQYLSCTQCAAPQANPPGDAEFFVTGYTVYGCSAPDSAYVHVVHPPKVVTNGDTTVCLGGYYRLRASGADYYSWSPSVGLTDPSSPDPVATPPATTTYTVAGSDSAHCFAIDKSVTINVNPIPTVDAGPDVTASAGVPFPLHITYSPDVVSWQWTPPNGLSCDSCPDPSASPTGNTFYTITVRNEDGCTAQDTMTVFVTCGGGNVFIPNTFSPNGDGMNDVFYPRGKGVAQVKSFRVFNRWGQLVFERYNFNVNDRSSGWDGSVGGQKLPPDVFVYICEVVCENDQVLLFKGDVTLLR